MREFEVKIKVSIQLVKQLQYTSHLVLKEQGDLKVDESHSQTKAEVSSVIHDPPPGVLANLWRRVEDDWVEDRRKDDGVDVKKILGVYDSGRVRNSKYIAPEVRVCQADKSFLQDWEVKWEAFKSANPGGSV